MSNGTQQPDIEHMIDNPGEYGFSWDENNDLHKKQMKITDRAPYIKHDSVARMTEVFGESYFLDSANGQSARVRDQGVLRDAIWEDKSIANDVRAMKRLVLERALGRKSRARRVTVIEKRIYVADDGAEFEDKAEFLAYQIDLRQKAEQS